MKKLLVIVDMQNDFVTGSLTNPDAERIVPGIVKYIEKWDGDIATTMDTHYDDTYLLTDEGIRLPIKHCIFNTTGHAIVKDIQKSLFPKHSENFKGSFSKSTFGSTKLGKFLYEEEPYDEIYFCGTCTDICVISNAIICKAYAPEARIIVLKDLCAGTTPENHENALKAMKQCQIDIE